MILLPRGLELPKLPELARSSATKASTARMPTRRSDDDDAFFVVDGLILFAAAGFFGPPPLPPPSEALFGTAVMRRRSVGSMQIGDTKKERARER